MIVEETGEAHDSNKVKMAYNTFKHLKAFAKFDQNENSEELQPPELPEPSIGVGGDNIKQQQGSTGIGLNLGYTINLNLPATSDPAVFDAIFKSLKSNLLSDSDA